MSEQSTAAPSTQMQALDRLVGQWSVKGGAEGTVSYEWLEGGFFLLQRVELDQGAGIEVIGHLHPFMGEQSEDVHSRFYGNQGGTFDYVYELDGDTLTIWAGERGSPAYYEGTFSADGNELTGSWVYPGGGGYDSVATRI